MSDPYWCDEPVPDGPLCEVDGDTYDTYGGEHYWRCGRPGAITVDGTLMCEDHAGERGYGPKREEYGFDPEDGLNPTPEVPPEVLERARQRAAEVFAAADNPDYLGI